MKKHMRYNHTHEELCTDLEKMAVEVAEIEENNPSDDCEMRFHEVDDSVFVDGYIAAHYGSYDDLVAFDAY